MLSSSAVAASPVVVAAALKQFLKAARTCYREFDGSKGGRQAVISVSNALLATSASASSTSSSSHSAITSSSSNSINSSCNICIGNEAGDADSIISSICFAFLKSKLKNESESSISVFPFTHVDRKQVRLLGDVGILLSTNGLSVDDLMCIDDSLSPKDYVFKNASLTLLDHNAMSKRMKALYSEDAEAAAGFTDKEVVVVTEILDHHLDLNQHVVSCSGNARQIAFDSSTNKALVGSTCTLVFEYYSQHLRPLGILLDTDVANLLLGVILLDTFNMDAKQARGSPRDLVAIQYLMDVCKHDKLYCDKLFVTLRDAKMNPEFWHRLEADEALRMDYKDFDIDSKGFMVGIASICTPLNLYLQKTNSIEAIKEYFSLSKRKVMVVMSIYNDENNETRRQILISCSTGDIWYDKLIDGLPRICGLELEPIRALSDKTSTSSDIAMLKLGCFNQANVQNSRKQVAPMIQSILNSI